MPCAVSASLLERLGSRGSGIAQPLVERVGALCAEAAEAKAEREEGEEAEAYEGAAAAAMGAAIRHLGPQQVLEMLPLNIAEVWRSCHANAIIRSEEIVMHLHFWEELTWFFEQCQAQEHAEIMHKCGKAVPKA